MHHDPLGKDLLDERAPLRPHALELLRRIDEEIEPRPYVVDPGEVAVALEEGARRIGDDDEVEVAPLVGLAPGDRAEDNGLPRLGEVGRKAPPELGDRGLGRVRRRTRRLTAREGPERSSRG
jgi:hypothetical protein